MTPAKRKDWSKGMKKFIAVLITGLLLLSTTACLADTSWVVQTDDCTVTSGVYIGMLYFAYEEAATMVESSSGDLLKKKIDDLDAATWIEDNALTAAKRFIAVETKFDELGLDISEDEQSDLDLFAESKWKESSQDYLDNGMNQDSFTTFMTNFFKSSKVFDSIYGEKGSKEVTEAELASALKDNYTPIRMLSRYKFKLDGTGEPLEDEVIDEYKAELDGYAKRINAGEEYADVMADYNEKSAEIKAEAAAAEEAAAEAAAEDGDFADPAVPDEGGDDDGDTSTTTQAPENDTTTAAADDADDDTAADDETAAADDEEADAAAQYSIIEKSQEAGYGFPEGLMDEIFAAPVGKASVLDLEEYFILIDRGDITEDEENLDNYKGAILDMLKSDEFDEQLDAWVEELSVSENKWSISRYKAKNLIMPKAQEEVPYDYPYDVEIPYDEPYDVEIPYDEPDS